MSSDLPPRIWALLGAHRGDNNQVLALAEALGLSFEAKSLRYNFLRRLPVRLLGATLASLQPKSRALVSGTPPDLLIAIGHRAVPVARAIRDRSGGRTRLVQLGNPRIPPHHFDLIITTAQYGVAEAENVAPIAIALGRPADHAPLTDATAALLARYPAPRRLLLLGGPTRFWTLRSADVVQAIGSLTAEAGGSLIVLGSPRTPRPVLDAAAKAIDAAAIPATLVPIGGPPAYRELVAAAHAILVTADSASMISEAVATGKPVGLVPVRRTWIGALWMGLMDWLRPGQPIYPRDLRFFWAELERQGLADIKKPGVAPDVIGRAVSLVRPLLALPARPATAARDGDQSVPVNPA